MIPHSRLTRQVRNCFGIYLHQIKGFTLIELLVVVIIISIILSFATLSINQGGAARQLEQEAQRLASLLRLASQQAILQGQEFGVSFDQDEYRFYQLQGQAWQILQEDIFRPHTLPSGLHLELRIEGAPVTLGETCQKSTCLPQLLLLSSGEFTPFAVMFTVPVDNSLNYQLTGTATGEMIIQHDDSQ